MRFAMIFEGIDRATKVMNKIMAAERKLLPPLRPVQRLPKQRPITPPRLPKNRHQPLASLVPLRVVLTTVLSPVRVLPLERQSRCISRLWRLGKVVSGRFGMAQGKRSGDWRWPLALLPPLLAFRP
ncbi:hypothetical protein DEA98_06925 [Brucella pseudogrignonensis]|nr:hypothetical protein [Brucella pseudogrignonensis]